MIRYAVKDWLETVFKDAVINVETDNDTNTHGSVTVHYLGGLDAEMQQHLFRLFFKGKNADEVLVMGEKLRKNMGNINHQFGAFTLSSVQSTEKHNTRILFERGSNGIGQLDVTFYINEDKNNE